jgi:hypothetical protein
MILWMAATMAIYSAWHSVHRWGSIYPGWYYQTREICTPGNKKIYKIAERNLQHWFSLNMWCGVLGNNLTGPCYQGKFNRSVLEEFSEKWISTAFLGCSSCNMMEHLHILTEW